MTWAVEADGLSYSIDGDLDLEGCDGGEQGARPDAVLLDLECLGEDRARKLASDCRQTGLPVIGVVSVETLVAYDTSLSLDDFILQPFRPAELLVRLDQAIYRKSGSLHDHLLRVGELVVDKERYEVRLPGRRVVLTYKECQLWVLLASNPGKVYTRASLLSQVWEYDYFGGTRTVDVHIRRLRSKIEDAGHSFIETIWNVGYRFRVGG